MNWKNPVSQILRASIDGLSSILADSDGSPSKASSRPEAIQSLPTRRPSTPKASDSAHRMFSRSRTHKPASTGNDYHGANATFLTECSFGVAHDRLVEVITDVQPFSPHWEELSSIDLSNKRLESVARLKEFLPRLDALSLWVLSFSEQRNSGEINFALSQK
jgi:hypothetical protein